MGSDLLLPKREAILAVAFVGPSGGFSLLNHYNLLSSKDLKQQGPPTVLLQRVVEMIAAVDQKYDSLDQTHRLPPARSPSFDARIG